ncbi:hypothetical protein T484DRAFT_1800345 [Baffinella frigidus]|nr:hypothetical protein T484DRAFT_1800345 [Cryptophyta sp. CCMP2293]
MNVTLDDAVEARPYPVLHISSEEVPGAAVAMKGRGLVSLIATINAVLIAVLIACTYLDVGHSILPSLFSSSSAVHLQVEASGVVHVLKAWGKTVEMEEKIAEQAKAMKAQENVIAEQTEEIAGLRGENEEQNTAISMLQVRAEQQNSVIKALERRAAALTHVFTWSTDSKWSPQQSLEYTFTDGVSGYGSAGKPTDKDYTHWMGFALKEGPACTVHLKCSILDKNDKVLRVVGQESWSDFAEPPNETGPAGTGRGAAFNLSEEDKTGAVRADGSIKLRMVVHLYLPE